MDYKNGNCYGSSQICQDFRLAPEISKEELDRWPKYGSVSRLKIDSFKNMEYEYNDYYYRYY